MKQFLSFLLVSLLLTGCFGGQQPPSNDDDNQNTLPSVPEDIQTVVNADPNKADTDGDGLLDKFEILMCYPLCKPDKVDTDSNGTSDALEDLDKDGLNNTQEQAANTNPLNPDSDGDGLTDAEEVVNHKTNPLLQDTDNDGVSDKREILNGTDPLKPDADKVVESSDHKVTKNPDTGEVTDVVIKIAGAGDLAGNARVTTTPDGGLFGQIGQSYNITTNGTFDSANLTFKYDTSDKDFSNENNLAVITINPTTGVYERLPSRVDSTNKTITATTTHFSEFVVVDVQDMKNRIAALPDTCNAVDDVTVLPIDVALVIDSSGSMSSTDPSNLRISASQRFIDSMKTTDRATVIDFNDGARIRQGLTTSKEQLKNALSGIGADNGTNITSGVSAALGEFQRNSNDTRTKIVILFTDGDGDYDNSLTNTMLQRNIRAITIGLSDGVNKTLLESIAKGTNGIYRQIDSADQIVEVFKQLQTVFGDDGTDTDKDGITDCQEVQGIYTLSIGETVFTDPRKDDTDGDGIIDGGEIVGIQPASEVFPFLQLDKKYAWVGFAYSNPMKSDSDGDGLLDPDEFAFATDPFDPDTDNDGLRDRYEIETSQSNPHLINTDGDSWSDWEENKRDDLDPATYDYTVGESVGEFLKGCVIRDIVELTTVPQFIGYLLCSFSPPADVFDLLVNSLKGDYADAALSAVGIIPIAGDTSKGAAKTAKFVRKNPGQRVALRAALKKMDNFAPYADELVGILQKSGAWKLPPLARGRLIEDVVTKLPRYASSSHILKGNFPKIDVWDAATGKITSIKSLDLDAKTYATVGNFRSVMRKYIGQVEDAASGVPLSGRGSNGSYLEIQPRQVKQRELFVALPREAQGEFLTEIAKLQKEAQEQGVNLIVKVVK